MIETTWRIYNENEIAEDYRGNDKVLILNFEDGYCNVTKIDYKNIGALVVFGNSGVIFDCVDFDKLRTTDYNKKRFDECVKGLEELLLIPQEAPA